MAAHEVLRLEDQRSALTTATHGQAKTEHIRRLDGLLTKAIKGLTETD
jgi:hypothetical protein